jgi:hypothetical protein
MLKREITYEDFNGEKATDTFYFNLTKTEIIELEVSYEGGLEAALKRIVATNDSKNLIAEFRRIVLLAYGVKSDDGKRFIKSNELREEFSQTAAYDALFMELATNDEAAATFIKGIIPKDMTQEVAKSEVSVLPLPPQPPKG